MIFIKNKKSDNNLNAFIIDQWVLGPFYYYAKYLIRVLFIWPMVSSLKSKTVF